MKNLKDKVTFDKDIGLIDAYQLMFIGLKLSGAISWGWLLVFAPYLIVVGIMLLLIIVAMFTS